MLEVTDIELKKRLAFDNPWWGEGGIPARFSDWPRRAFFDGFMELVQQNSVNRAVVLMGPRRVGKTVMLTQGIQKLIDDGVPAERICYVSVDTPIYTGVPIERLLDLFLDTHHHRRTDSVFMIYDEIQYHPDWERHLKSLVDSFPSIRFVVSGSAAAALKMKSTESGAGRFTDVLLPPLNFPEFLRFKGLEDRLVDMGAETFQGEALNDAFVEYLNYGGFPEAVLIPDIREAMDRFVANDIVDKVLLRDIPSLYGIQDTQKLKRFFTMLAYNTGNEVSYEGLSQASGVAKNTIRKYLDYLEAAFLIHRLYRVDQRAKRFKRVTQFKVYLTNCSIRSALFGPVDADSSAMGHLAETAVVSQAAQSALTQLYYYARWQSREVDLVFVDPTSQRTINAYEIKWSDKVKNNPESELPGLIEFCANTGLSQAFVTTRTFDGTVRIGDLKIIFCPTSVACYAFAKFGVIDPLGKGLDPRTYTPFSS